MTICGHCGQGIDEYDLNSSMGFHPGDLVDKVSPNPWDDNEGFVVPGAIEEAALRQEFADVLEDGEVLVIGLNTGEACGFPPYELQLRGRLDDDRTV